MTLSENQLLVDVTYQLTIAQPPCHAQPMVDKNSLRAAFTGRLHQALDDAGVRTRGRGVDVHRRLKSQGIHKTTQAISKWLNAEAIAEADSMVALCAWLGVRREWLEYGVLPKRHAMVQSLVSHNKPTNEGCLLGQVPLISWVQATIWSGKPLDSSTSETLSWLFCPVPISANGYALKVNSDSMTNPGLGRSYPVGCIVFVDPAADIMTGDGVIARISRTSEATFKILAEDAGLRFLRPINPQYPIIEIVKDTRIIGKVIGTFIPE